MLGLASLLVLPLLVIAHFLRSLYLSWREDRALRHIPTHQFPDGRNDRARYIDELRDLVESGYRRYNKHGQAFKVPIPIGGYSVKYRVILPKDHLEEIKSRSNALFSWARASAVIFAEDYTGAPRRGPWSGRALRIGIHQNLATITSTLDSRIEDYFMKHLPQDPSHPESIDPMHFFVQEITTVTNSLLCGEELAADPEWIRQTADFATNRYKSADDVRKWPPVVAALVSPLLPSVRRLRASRRYVKRKLTPMYEELRRQDQLGGEKNKAAHRKSSYGFEWLWGGAPDEVTLDDFSDTMMRTLIASIHTTAKTMTIALIDLLTAPGLKDELIEEVQAAIRADGSVDIDSMVKTDGFLKESQRLTPVFILTMNRIVMQPYTFSASGLTLPAGIMTTAATAAIATDPDTFGRDSNQFDPHRFTRLREANKAAARVLDMGAATEDSLGFGFGSQACPGRFFAVNQMKIMLAKLLVNWDLTLERDGKEYRGPRPVYQYKDFSVLPPSNYSLRMRRRHSCAFAPSLVRKPAHHSRRNVYSMQTRSLHSYRKYSSAWPPSSARLSP